MRKLKTNVVKREWTVPVVRKKDGRVMMLPVTAETFNAAKLLIPEGFIVDEDSLAKNPKVSEN